MVDLRSHYQTLQFYLASFSQTRPLAKSMKIAVVVLAWNSAKYISGCLTSLKMLHPGENKVEVIVVDNASSDNSANLAKSKYPAFKIIKNSSNLGYAQGNNTGIREALKNDADFVWVINPDVTVSPDSLLALLASAGKYPQAGVFTPKIYFAKGFEFHKERYSKSDLGKVIWSAGGFIDWANLIAVHRGVDEVDIGQYNANSLCDFATGASIFIRAPVFKRIGLIDPKYYLYYEENDFCQRSRSAGWQIMYIADSVCWHANAQATGIGSPLVDYYTTRNRLLFGFRWASLRTKFALFRESLKLLFTGRKWQKRGILDFYLMRLGKGSHVTN